MVWWKVKSQVFVDNKFEYFRNIVLSQANTHGHSQLKYQKLRVGSCTMEVLEWFNYTTQAPTPSAKLAARGNEPTCIVTLPMLVWAQPDGEESCIMLESGLTPSLSVAKVLQCSMWILFCTQRTLWMRPWTGVCKPLMPVFCTWANEPTFDSLHKSLAQSAVTWRTSKKQTFKIGGGGGGRCFPDLREILHWKAESLWQVDYWLKGTWLHVYM